jgi:hypothetical protein
MVRMLGPWEVADNGSHARTLRGCWQWFACSDLERLLTMVRMLGPWEFDVDLFNSKSGQISKRHWSWSFFVLRELMCEVIVCFVGIRGIFDHHCLNFLFIKDCAIGICCSLAKHTTWMREKDEICQEWRSIPTWGLTVQHVGQDNIISSSRCNFFYLSMI